MPTNNLISAAGGYYIDEGHFVTALNFKTNDDAAEWAWDAAQQFSAYVILDEAHTTTWSAYHDFAHTVLLSDLNQAAAEVDWKTVRPLVRRLWWDHTYWPEADKRTRGLAEALLWFQLEAVDSEPDRREILQRIALATLRAIYAGVDARIVSIVLLRASRPRPPVGRALANALYRACAQLRALAHSITRRGPPVIDSAGPRLGWGASREGIDAA